jgi:predicted RNase H-like nuclease (RuvC/YqgF family)
MEYLKTLDDSNEVAELQVQLKSMAKDIVHLRAQNETLKEQNRIIPELEQRIRILSESLDQELSRRSQLKASERIVDTSSLDDIQHDGSIESLLNEITQLKNALTTKEIVEQELRREFVEQKSASKSQEFKCKQIISSCCGIPIECVDSLLDPLLQAIESEDPMEIMDMNRLSSFMTKVKENEIPYRR